MQLAELLDFRPRFTDGTRIASNPLELVTGSTSLDFTALSVFFRLGFFLGADTPFLNIRQILPEAPPAARPTSISRAEAIRTYATRFEHAVERTLPMQANTYAPLSGGRDSRHIAFALHHFGALPDAFISYYHLPPHPNDDPVVAQLVAQKLGARWVGVKQPKCFVGNILRLFHESGFLTDEGSQVLPGADWLRQNAENVYDGIGGDIMSAGLFQWDRQLDGLYRQGKLREAAREIIQAWIKPRQGWEQLIAPDLGPLVSLDIAIERIVEELEKHAAHHNPLRSFYFWNRTRREVALGPFMIYRGINPITPYLDPELWEFLDSLPFEMVTEGNFHTETILAAYPQFAGIRFEEKGTRAFSRCERIAFALDYLRIGAQLKSGTILKRALSLFRDSQQWWGREMTLYVPALLRKIS